MINFSIFQHSDRAFLYISLNIGFLKKLWVKCLGGYVGLRIRNIRLDFGTRYVPNGITLRLAVAINAILLNFRQMIGYQLLHLLHACNTYYYY